MSLEDVRKQNKERVVEAALKCFSVNGIENTKVSDIAKQGGITERSVYRYFNTKADLVLEAALLFWAQSVEKSKKVYARTQHESLPGTEQIRLVLKAYADQYFVARKELLFIQEAEAYLSRNNMIHLIRNDLPSDFYKGTTPLAKAILKGMKDGTVKCSEERAERLYYNSYDSLLGLMQKMANTPADSPSMNPGEKERLDEFCDMLTDYFCR